MNFLRYLPYYILSLLPMRALHIISEAAAFIIFHVVRYRRGVVAENLRRSFPEKDEKEIYTISRRFYLHFCDMWIETDKVLTIGRRNMQKRVVVTNPELVNSYFEMGKSVILYAGHLGNWEWLLALPLSLRHRVTAFYLPLSNRYFDGYIRLVRERFGVMTIPSERGYRVLGELSRKGELTATIVIGDQSPAPMPNLFFTGFLNRPTAFLEGAERMAAKLHHAVVFPLVVPVSRGHFSITFLPVYNGEEPVTRGMITTKYVSLLENAIRETPWSWLWSHRRWKIDPP